MVENNGSDPYLVLGILPDASNSDIKRAYRVLVLEHHPDRLIANGVPEEMAEMGVERIAAINVAYDLISKARKF
jgi:DnaJ like chaperone protein